MHQGIFILIELLSQTMGEYWSVEKMAAVANLSPSRLKQVFKKVMGMTPKAYLLNIRIEKAYEYFSDPFCLLHVSEIGVLVGLTDERHFTRAFKKKFGLTPTQCRLEAYEKYQANFKNGQE